MFSWMHWTLPTMIGLAAIGLTILGLVIWDIISPNMPRKGFLPMETTRGDRAFISIISMFTIFLLWLAFIPQVSIYLACIVVALVIFVIMRWG